MGDGGWNTESNKDGHCPKEAAGRPGDMGDLKPSTETEEVPCQGYDIKDH